MHLIVLARFNFYRQHRKAIIVVDKEIDLATLLVVVIMQLESMGMEFLSNHRLIHRPEIYAEYITKYSIDIGAIKKIGEQSYITKIEFQKILALVRYSNSSA